MVFPSQLSAWLFRMNEGVKSPLLHQTTFAVKFTASYNSMQIHGQGAAGCLVLSMGRGEQLQVKPLPHKFVTVKGARATEVCNRYLIGQEP